MKIERTDPHRPTSFIPEDYRYVDFIYLSSGDQGHDGTVDYRGQLASIAKLRSETELLKSKISEKERRKAAGTSNSPDRTFVREQWLFESF